MRIYVASSWRNISQPGVVHALRGAGHRVFDFRCPAPGDHGFRWSEIDPEWRNWEPRDFVAHLRHPLARTGFAYDFEAMQTSDACVLLLPSGHSSHLEAGWFVGKGRPLYVLMPEAVEPELLYRMATAIVFSTAELLSRLKPAAVAGRR
jgi:hypothetical protein